MALTAFPPKHGRAHKYSHLKQEEKQKLLTYDGHEGVEVADVEALAGHVDEELDDPSSVFLFHWLRGKQASGVLALNINQQRWTAAPPLRPIRARR